MTLTEPRQDEQTPASGPRRKPLIVAGVTGAVVVAGSVYIAGWTPLMGVKSVTVEGTTTVSSETLIQTAAIVPGTPMMKVDLRAATARLADLPQVASVDVTRAWPRKVVITVTERDAVAMQKSGSGWELLDANGNAFALAPSKPKDLPTIERSDDPATNTAMFAVLASISPEIRADVASVSASSPNDVRFTLRGDDAIVNWGSPELSDFKSQVLAVLLSTKAGYYNVSNPNTPTTADAPPVPKPAPTASGEPSPSTSPSESAAAEQPVEQPVEPAAEPAPAVSPMGVVTE